MQNLVLLNSLRKGIFPFILTNESQHNPKLFDS